MPAWSYFERPTNFAFHDLTTFIKPPPNLKSLLGNSLKYIPTQRFTNNFTKLSTESLTRLNRDLDIRMFFAGDKIEDNDDFDSAMHIKSDWTPPTYGINQELQERFKQFTLRMKPLFKKRKGKSNLLKHQRTTLRNLQQRKDLMIVQCDKNLGPAVIETEKYIQLAFKDHLNDSNTYKFLSPFEAAMKIGQIKLALASWIKKYANKVNTQCNKYMTKRLKANKDPYAYLYLTMKVHKGTNPLKSRPICSYSGCLLEPLGQAINKLLQPFAQQQPTYLKNSLDLKQKLEALGTLPPNTFLFTADAQSMYTNLPIDHAIQCIRDHLRSMNNPTIPIQAIVTGLKLIMHNNIMKFGDCIILQKDGTAMGAPPAPPVAQISYGTHEERFVPLFQSTLLAYYRYIDDVFGAWTITDMATDPALWLSFQAHMQDFPGLTWDISPRSKQVDFLDLTITIGDDNRFHFTLFEKVLNLHLYLPSGSAHPPGVLLGLVHGNVRRIHTLCSAPEDRRARTNEMFKHLLARGYKAPALLPIFEKAIRKVTGNSGPSTATVGFSPTQPAPLAEEEEEEVPRPIFFHLRYHPDDPPSSAIQQAWRDTMSNPPHKTPLADLCNYKRIRCGMSRLIVAYSRPHNLGNLLSYRKLITHGPSVSSYKSRDEDGA